MPIFALVNAGMSLAGLALDGPSAMVAAGAAVGLVLGKPLGILLFSGVLLKLRVVALPRGLTFRHLVVLGLVAGIGFTMSLFIAQLGFAEDKLLAAAKLGVLVASAGAAGLGLLAGRVLLRAAEIPDGAAATEDEAEGSTEL
jgi:NhaA family Na+:H+ antiporter